MQGFLSAALASAAPPRSPSSSARPAPAPLSSANLALHTSNNPPAPRRTVQQFLASVDRVHAANAYDLGPPPAGELDHVKTPPRAVEARRKRKLQDLEDRGESWITRDNSAPRAVTTSGCQQALVLIRPDADLLLRGSTTSETADLKQHERKKSLVASMMRRKSTPPANAASATQRKPLLPISGPSPASDESSILMPRTETKPATTRRKEVVEERDGKENRPEREKKSSLRKGRNVKRRDTDKDAVEQEELEEHAALLEARRDRRRQNALIRKDRSLAATAVGATAAAKLKKSKSRQRPMMTASDSNDPSDEEEEEEEENALETSGYRKRKGKGTQDARSRKKVTGLDRPRHVGQGRLTLKPVALGIFNKGKASARAKTEFAFDEEAFLSGATRNGNAVASSSASSSSSSSSSEASVQEVPSRRPASRNVGNHAPRTYGSRPSKRRSGSAIRQRVPDAGDEAPDLQEGAPDRDAEGHPSAAAALDRPASKRPAAAAKKRLSTKKQTPTFELDIPPWPKPSSLVRRSRPVDDDKGSAGAADADDADSTHPSILSAASLARRKAERTAAEKRMSFDGEQEIAPGEAARDAVSFDGGDASVHAPARTADEPFANDVDNSDLWQGPDDNIDSANTSGGAFERLLAQVTNAADDSFEVSPPSFEALSARSAIIGELGSQNRLRGALAPRLASEVGGAVLGSGADAYLGAAATIEEEDPTNEPAGDNTLISFLDEDVFDQTEPVASADMNRAQSASTAAEVAFRPLTPDDYGAGVPERFLTPSDLSPSYVVARLDEGASTTGLDDEAAFRTAMRQQWPKTLL